MSKVQLDVTRIVLVFPVVSLVAQVVHHLSVQAVALLMHGHLFVHALDPRLTIMQVGLKAPNLSLTSLPCLTRQEDITSVAVLTSALVRAQPDLAFKIFSNLTSQCFSLPFSLFSLGSSFIQRDVFLNLKRCSFTKLTESTDQLPFRR